MGLLKVALFMHRIGAAVDIPFTSNYGAQQNSSFGNQVAGAKARNACCGAKWLVLSCCVLRCTVSGAWERNSERSNRAASTRLTGRSWTVVWARRTQKADIGADLRAVRARPGADHCPQ